MTLSPGLTEVSSGGADGGRAAAAAASTAAPFSAVAATATAATAATAAPATAAASAAATAAATILSRHVLGPLALDLAHGLRTFRRVRRAAADPACRPEVKDILQEATYPGGHGGVGTHLRHLFENIHEDMVDAPVPPVIHGADDGQEDAQRLQRLLRRAVHELEATTVDDLGGDDLVAEKLTNKLHVPEHLRLVLHLGLKLLIAFQIVDLRRGTQVVVEGVLALVQEQSLEVDLIPIIVEHISLIDPLVKLDAEVGVHLDEVMLGGRLLENLPHKRLDVVLRLDAALQQLAVQGVELLHGQLVEDGLHRAGDRRIAVLLLALLTVRPRVLGRLQLGVLLPPRVLPAAHAAPALATAASAAQLLVSAAALGLPPAGGAPVAALGGAGHRRHLPGGRLLQLGELPAVRSARVRRLRRRLDVVAPRAEGHGDGVRARRALHVLGAADGEESVDAVADHRRGLGTLLLVRCVLVCAAPPHGGLRRVDQRFLR
mmetsp:Transcript_118449/g.342474  ORF Transcript_118449/g.342474 Transcript_118449/m.342474 type:complete len:489 (-) Transcript_118449:145-1611(-)